MRLTIPSAGLHATFGVVAGSRRSGESIRGHSRHAQHLADSTGLLQSLLAHQHSFAPSGAPRIADCRNPIFLLRRVRVGTRKGPASTMGVAKLLGGVALIGVTLLYILPMSMHLVSLHPAKTELAELLHRLLPQLERHELQVRYRPSQDFGVDSFTVPCQESCGSGRDTNSPQCQAVYICFSVVETRGVSLRFAN